MNRNWDVYANWGLGLGNTNWRLKLLSIHRGPGLLNTNWGLGATAVAEGQSQVPEAGKHIKPWKYNSFHSVSIALHKIRSIPIHLFFEFIWTYILVWIYILRALRLWGWGFHAKPVFFNILSGDLHFDALIIRLR